MATSCDPVDFDHHTVLTPGDGAVLLFSIIHFVKLISISALIRCNGQDITKKGGKPRNRIMVIMPSLFALPTKLQADLTLGNMHKLNTESPELIIETNEVVLLFCSTQKVSE
jgi:hypothetical protein